MKVRQRRPIHNLLLHNHHPPPRSETLLAQNCSYKCRKTTTTTKAAANRISSSSSSILKLLSIPPHKRDRELWTWICPAGTRGVRIRSRRRRRVASTSVRNCYDPAATLVSAIFFSTATATAAPPAVIAP
ncbi:unnamed protein product [Sphagnum troendelagicum]